MAWTKDQERAIYEINKNIIVSAGAGSGKTAVLSTRVLEHVKRGISVDELLVLTFTNAAAAEMKERIRKNLIDAKLNDEANKVDVAYITTFDSLALSILKKYSYKLNLSKNINVIDSSIISIKKEELLNEIFDKHYEEKDELFLKLIADFCVKDDKEIFDYIIKLNNTLDNSLNKQSILDNYISNYYNDNNIDNLVNNYINLLINKVNNIKELLESIKYYLDDDNYNKLNSAYINLINSNNYLDIKFNVNNIPTVRLSGASDESKSIREEISKEIKKLKELTLYNDINEIKESIYSTKDYIDIIIKLIKEFDASITKFKYSVSSFEFIDIAKMAISIVESDENIRNFFKNKYKEILIDEYQDTNDLQDKFISLIENNNCYMVGDIKQSIYRFRNANPNLFKRKYSEYASSNKDLKIDLNKNFRSRDKVLNNINLIFNLIMNEDLGGANYIDSHQMDFGLEPYLKVNKENYDMEFLNYHIEDKIRYSKEEIEIFAIAKDIKEKIKNGYTIMDKDSKEMRKATYSDFAILIDRSTSFDLFKKVFEYLNIPITIRKNSKINSSIDIDIIKNIYNLLICIDEKNYSKSFRYSFYSIARSYLFEYSDNDVLKIMVDNRFYNTDIYNVCFSIHENINNLTSSEVYDLILDKFDIINKLSKVGDVNNHIIILDYIKGIISSLEQLGYTYKDFYKYLNDIIDKGLDIELSINKGDEDSVKIMTIHTSKGLEFPIVYFPLLYKEFNKGDLKDKFIYDNNLGFISMYKNQEVLKKSILFNLLESTYNKEEVSEKLRLLYVALTRAREKMIFISSFDENILAYKDGEVINNTTSYSHKSFLDIFNSVYKYIRPYMYNINIDDLELTKDYNKTKVSNLNLDKGNIISVNELVNNSNVIDKKRLSKNVHELYTKDIKNNINLGLKMHSILEHIDFDSPNTSSLNEFEINLLNKFLDTKIFVGANDIYKEYEFMYEEDNTLTHGIIDLLLVFDNKNIIVDYKLNNISDEAYIKQLNGYKKYISSINNLNTEIYLYSILSGTLKKM